MKIGVIADDFTGASDIALTLAETGMRVVQYVGTPSNSNSDCDAGVVSLKSRTAPVQQAVEQSLAACEWLTSQGCEQIIYKVCSTFDSTDDGNIGPVLQALAGQLNESRIAVCPAFPENGRSVYMGHLFVGNGLLSESGMQNHPLTPMRDSDLRRVLARQTSWPVDHIDAAIVARGTTAIETAMSGEPAMVIVDAIHDSDLLSIGAALRQRRLLCGGSGIALGLPANFGIQAKTIAWSGSRGPAVVLSGSCSVATRAQIARYKLKAPSMELKAEDVMSGHHTAQSLAQWVCAQSHEAPLVYSSADPSLVLAAQDQFGKETVAAAIESLFANLAALLVNKGISRIVSAGGDTSGAIVTALDATSLQIGPRIAAGVPALKVDDKDLAITLKSGNFGDEDFFETAVSVLSAQS